MNRTLRPSQWCLWLISPLMLVGSAWAQSDEPLPPLPADPDAPPVDLPPATPVAPPAAQPSPPASPLYPPAPGSGYGTPAQYGYPSPPPAPPVPPAQPPTGVYLHDGFYLRMALGLGLHNITVAPHPGDTIHASTQNLLFDVGVGGTPMDGFAIGGRILEMFAANPSFGSDSAEKDLSRNTSLSVLQFFTDVYPTPDRGLHFMAAVGPATYSFSRDTKDSEEFSVMGAAFSIGAGWEAWVGQQWSMGGMLALHWMVARDSNIRLLAPSSSRNASNTESDEDVSLDALMPSLTWTITYH